MTLPFASQTNERKESMTFQLRDALTVGNIVFSDEFFSNSHGIREIKQQMQDEMRNFCILVEPSKTPFGKTKKTYSGKVGGRNDDLVIAIQLAVTGVRCFYQQERYRAFRYMLANTPACITLYSLSYCVFAGPKTDPPKFLDERIWLRFCSAPVAARRLSKRLFVLLRSM
jgi:hypothetical protein